MLVLLSNGVNPLIFNDENKVVLLFNVVDPDKFKVPTHETGV